MEKTAMIKNEKMVNSGLEMLREEFEEYVKSEYQRKIESKRG
jgi:hypothetical protein